MTLDAVIYFAGLAVWSGTIAYLLLFKLASREEAHSAAHHGAKKPVHPAPVHHAAPARPRRGYSTREGFRSFAKGDVLTIEDIVKGLSGEDR